MQLALLPSSAPAIIPRDYQTAAVDACDAIWAERPGSALIIVAPTGSGKTIMIGMTAERHLSRTAGGRVLLMTHVPELVEQSYTTFRHMFPHLTAGVYAAKLGRKDRWSKVTFALVQSVARNPDAFKDVTQIIVDEAHMIPHAADGQYREVIDKIREMQGGRDKVQILGLTATPWRLNSGNLLEPYKDAEPLFDEIAYEIEMLDLLEQGHLCKVISKASKVKLNVDGVHKRMGEYVEAELNERCNTDALNEKIADEIVRIGTENNRKSWLVFAIGVDHAQRLADMIRERDVTCEMVCGETPTAERARIIRDFKTYRVRCLTSVNVLSTGFDHKGVDMAAMVRPTASPGLYLQQAGRLLRVMDGKPDAILLDFSGNVMRHGLLTNVRGVHKKKKDDEELFGPRARECPECGHLNEPGVGTCAGCGYEWPRPKIQDRERKLSAWNTAERVMDDAVWVEVQDATYRHSSPVGRPATLQLLYRVTHNGAIIQASEVFCFDHEPHSWAHQRARAEWMKRTGRTPPSDVIEAAQRIEELQRPGWVRMVQSDCGRYWNVKGVK